MKKEWKKEFITLFNRLIGRRSDWEVWNDFLTVSSSAFANVMHTPEWDEREQQYLSIIRAYDKEELEVLTQLLGIVTMALEDNPKQDFLGDIYTTLELNQHQKGQFFTPYHICEFMAEIQFCGDWQMEVERKGFISVSDPACGGGAMLIAFANSARSHGLNYQEKVLFVAQDIDAIAAKMCYIQLTLLGCSACIIIGDSLLKPGLHPDNDVYYTPMYYMNAWRFCKKPKEEELVNEAAIEAVISEPSVSVEDIREAFCEDANGQFSFDFLKVP